MSYILVPDFRLLDIRIIEKRKSSELLFSGRGNKIGIVYCPLILSNRLEHYINVQCFFQSSNSNTYISIIKKRKRIEKNNGKYIKNTIFIS